MARSHVARELLALGGQPVWREGVVTDNHNLILDVHGMAIEDALAMEARINHIAGVVCNGLFAARPADILLLGAPSGVETVLPPLCNRGETPRQHARGLLANKGTE